jgi:hypothetical protein
MNIVACITLIEPHRRAGFGSERFELDTRKPLSGDCLRDLDGSCRATYSSLQFFQEVSHAPTFPPLRTAQCAGGAQPLQV